MVSVQSLGEYPLFASLIIRAPGGNVSLCGGTLAHEDLVSTAAHYVEKGVTSIELTFRVVDFFPEGNETGQQRRTSNKTCMMAGYQIGIVGPFDVALVKLSESIE